jgi:selenocysteine-specific elongation factor
MFRKPLNSAKQGDRIALLVTQIESEKIERGLACIPGSLKQIHKFVIDMNMIRLYKRPIKNKAKFHIISGHQTVMS